MTLDNDAVVHKKYSVERLAPDFISSTGTPAANILWVGCSDSWITETGALNVLPEETFVHRNLGNIVSNGDLSSTSAVEYAVDLLKVKHIVICGHYDCALVKADKDPGAIHGWYKDLQTLHKANDDFLCQHTEMGVDEKDRHLVEVYVLAEAEWLKKQPIVAKAIRQKGLQVHAFVFDKTTARCVRLVETPVKKTLIPPSRCGTSACTGSCNRSQLEKDTAF